MATRFEKVYVRDSKTYGIKQITESDIEEIVKIANTDRSPKELKSVIFRIMWGGEYLDLTLSGDKFVPQEGSVQILNIPSFHKCFSIKELCSIIQSSTRFLIFEGIKPLEFVSLQIFTKIKLIRSKDYEKTLKDLEEAGIVGTTTSINALSLSGMRFYFKRPEDQLVYGNNHYEVDSLGGDFIKGVTEAIEKAWIQLKEGEKEN